MDTQQTGETTSAVETTPLAERHDRPYELLNYIKELAKATGLSLQWAAWAVVYEDQIQITSTSLKAIPPWPDH